VIVDTSAVLAIVFAEEGYETLVVALSEAASAGIAAPNVAEAGIVLRARLGNKAPGLIERFLQELRIEVIPFDEAHVAVAVEAFWRYGKGRHRAALNFGDCMSYAVAKLADAPLLYVGDNFSHTDIAPAVRFGVSIAPSHHPAVL
jgi:ribonuclease VapC